MTTIIANQEFLIADKRTTHTVNYRQDAHISDKSTVVLKTDSYVKISLAPAFRALTYQGIRVRAVGCSGHVPTQDLILGYIRRAKLNTVQQLAAIGLVLKEHSGASLLFFLEDGRHCTVRFDNGGSTIRHVDSEKLAAIGSGAHYLSEHAEWLTAKHELTLEEMFMYLVMSDSYSSMDYSVYSLKEDRLYTIVRPTSDDYLRKVMKVHAAMGDAFALKKTTYR